jgi:hypothetical protein
MSKLLSIKLILFIGRRYNFIHTKSKMDDIFDFLGGLLATWGSLGAIFLHIKSCNIVGLRGPT